MSVLPAKRKREVSSCVPCYTRKQKCDRQYPCDRCSRRRQPELCAYYPTASPTSTTEKSRDGADNMHTAMGIGAGAGLGSWVVELDSGEQDNFNLSDGEPYASGSSPTSISSRTTARERSSSSSLAEAFGYYGPSEFSTLALVRKLVPEDDGPDAKDMTLPADVAAEVRKVLDTMLGRPIIDVLVRYFFTNVNWIDQLLYPPWFLVQYQRWWSLDRISSVAEVEFAILFLRVCCYASQFLPSPGYTIDSIKGVPLGDIRKSCEEVISFLSPICTSLDSRGSLIRVQHIGLASLASRVLCHMNAVWEHVSCATRVAQQIGLHLDASTWPGDIDEIEKEMRRRTFCNLYIWDSCLSLRLQRIPFLPDDAISANIMPRMRLVPKVDLGADAPDVFTERVLRAQLNQFWRRHRPKPSPGSKPNYDVVAAEERYEAFCRMFLTTVPPAFALAHPDRQWDEHLPTLPMQRQLLHIAVFEFLCCNFRPTLLVEPDELGYLPGYKQVLTAHGRKALAVAALSLLESVTGLHVLMGGSHTRYSGIITPIFEGAVPLLCLCADPIFLGGGEGEGVVMGAAAGGGPRRPPTTLELDAAIEKTKIDPLGARLNTVSRAECMQAARSALGTLQTLAEVSEMAEVGARTLAQLISRVENSGGSSCSSASGFLAPQVCSTVDCSDTSGVESHNAGGDGVPQVRQATVESICQWPFDPNMGDFAGVGPQDDLNLAATAIMLGMEEGGDATKWEDVLRNITGNTI